MKSIIAVVTIVTLFHYASCGVIYSTIQCVNETLHPCTTHPALPESILCQNINDIRTFVHVIRCGSRRNMQEVFLERSTLDYLPLYILDFCGFIFLNVKSVVLSKLLEGNVLVKLQQLHLDTVIVRDPSWNWEPVSVLRHLLRFSLSNMKLEALDSRLVDNLNEKLQSLTLVSTNTTAIADNALERFADLAYLSVENNEIVELKRSMFPTPSKIKYFYFPKNKITALPNDLFMDMPELESVGLQGNQISEMHEHTFRPIWRQLSVLLFEENPLKCHCKMLWLAKKTSPAVLTGECYAPKAYFGKELKHLSIDDFECPGG